jgi:S1-C subfamily serine protease
MAKMIRNHRFFQLSYLIIINSSLICPSTYHFAVGHPQEKNTASFIKKAQASVVSIQTFTSKSKKGFCRVGSGFIYNEAGFVVTRQSVINGGDSIVVTLTDGRQETAWVVYRDEDTEMALLKLPYDDIHPIPLGNASDLKTGSQITVLGNSLGVFPSVTLGTFIGKRADGLLDLGVVVPPGNSGSPVLDESGQLIGILAGRVMKSGNRQGVMGKMGIALPVERIREIVDPALHSLSMKKGWIGITVVDLEGRYSGKGVRVVNLVSGGPADRAGICLGDTIIGVEGESVRYAHELAEWVQQSAPDRKIRFIISTGGKEIAKSVNVSPKPWTRKKGFTKMPR